MVSNPSTQSFDVITPQKFVETLQRSTDFFEKTYEEMGLLSQIPEANFNVFLEGIDQKHHATLESIFFAYMAALTSLDERFQAKDPLLGGMTQEQLFQFAGDMAVYFFLELKNSELNASVVEIFLGAIEKHYEDFYNKFSEKLNLLKESFIESLSRQVENQPELCREFAENLQKIIDHQNELTQEKIQHAQTLIASMSSVSQEKNQDSNNLLAQDKIYSLFGVNAFLPAFAGSLSFSIDVYAMLDLVVEKYNIASKAEVINAIAQGSALNSDIYLKEHRKISIYMNRFFFGLTKLVESREAIFSKAFNK